MIDRIKNIGNRKKGAVDPITSPQIISSIIEGLDEETLRSQGERLMIPSTEALVAHAKEAGLEKHGVQLNALIIAGNTVFGLVNDYEQQGRDTAVNRVSLVQIPIGIKDGQNSMLVTSVDLDTLQKPRPAGYLQDWEKVSVGRSSLPESGDNEMSSKHFDLIVGRDLRDVEILDKSTNGTQVIDLNTISKAYAEGNVVAEQLNDLRLYLADHPHYWLPDNTGKQVVYPH